MKMKEKARIIQKIYRQYIVLIYILCNSLEAYGEHKFIHAQEYMYDTSKKIRAQIGTKSQSRISFGSFGIKEVVGDANKYTLIHDSIGGNVMWLH